MASCRNQRDWTFLLPEIIDIILEKITDSFSTFVSFVSVCQRWRFVALEEMKQKKSDNVKKLEILRTCRNKLPLLVAETDLVSCSSASRRFFALPSDGKGYRLRKHLINCRYSYGGSSFGWLIGLKSLQPSPYDVGVEIVLLNPFSCARKCLPLLENVYSFGPFGGCDKAVLSSDPSIKGCNYELLIIQQLVVDSSLACYRSCTNSWMPTLEVEYQHGRVVDAVFYGGKIYAITFRGNLFQVDFDTAETKVVVVFHGNQTCNRWYDGDSEYSRTLHLVVSNEGHGLLMVKQQNIKDFEVFKLCCKKKEGAERWTWVEINNLGDQALFVGRNDRGSSCFSACVSTVEFPQCWPNCIYYTCATPGFGVFNLELKQHFESWCIVSGADVVPLSSQIWMVPNLKGT